MKEFYKNVFVVLVYRNTQDLKNLFCSLKEKVVNYKVIVVDSFFNQETSKLIERISLDNSADYISVENKGYSYGNNCGIKHALNKYDFNFLIISNPDIIIKKYDDSKLALDCINAPEIITKTGKRQNPMKPFHSFINEKLCYMGYKYNKKVILFAGIGINKIYRNIWTCINKINRNYIKIYEAHGSFIIFPSEVVVRLGENVFDENMFLFAEEDVIANKAKNNQISILYNNNVSVLHNEDGSMKLGNISTSSETKKSFMYYYETYVLK